MKRPFYRLKNYLFPTRANAYHPGIFHKESVMAIAAILIFVQVAYFAVTTIVFHKTNFLAAVLPGVLTALTNTDRTQQGVGTLTDNALLDKAAQAKADDMAARGYFSHVTPDGKTPWYWLQQAGYNYTYAGENLAVNFTDSKDVEDAWMKSPTHRANIVKPQFTQIGIAVANGKYKGQDATFVVQFFGTPAKATVASGTKTKPVASVKSATTSGQVLGEEIEPPNAVASALTSPDQLVLAIVGGILFLIVLLFSLAIFVKVRVQYLSVILGGVVLIAIAGASFLMSETRASNQNVELPTDTNSASVYIGFSG